MKTTVAGRDVEYGVDEKTGIFGATWSGEAYTHTTLAGLKRQLEIQIKKKPVKIPVIQIEDDYREALTASKKAIGSVTNVKVSPGGWCHVLKDAEDGLAQAKARVRILKRTISTIHEKIEAGEPFPVSAVPHSGNLNLMVKWGDGPTEQIRHYRGRVLAATTDIKKLKSLYDARKKADEAYSKFVEDNRFDQSKFKELTEGE